MLNLPLEWRDPATCLSRWLSELPGASTRQGLDEGAHEAFRSALRGARRSVREAGRRSSELPHPLVMMERGIIQPAELLTDMRLLLRVLDDIVAGAAAHQSGVDWLGHLIRASTFTNLPTMTGSLAHLYLKLIGSDGLQRLWDHDDHDDHGWQSALVRRRNAEASFADVSVCEPGWSPPPMMGWPLADNPSNWRWMGVPLHGEEISDAAWQVAARGGCPPLVCRDEVSLKYQLLAVHNINPEGFEAREVLSDQLITAQRDPTTHTGWRLSTC